MRKVLVIGSGGSGKTTFARKLARKTGLPLVHLDSVYWRPGWTPPPRQEWLATVERLVQEPAWIIDGNYGSTLARRLEACDTAILLDVSPWTCTGRVARRMLLSLGRSRPDMPAGCAERLDPGFLRSVASFRARQLPGILAALKNAEHSGTRVVVLRNRVEMQRVLSGAAPHRGWDILGHQPQGPQAMVSRMIRNVGGTHIKSRHRASCHCGLVVLELDLPDGIVDPRRCDCSICRRKGTVVASVPLSGLHVVAGAEHLKLYRFNTGVAKHFFCGVCGIHTHHQRRSSPDEYGYNVGCLDGVDPFAIAGVPTNDGVNHPADRGGAAG